MCCYYEYYGHNFIPRPAILFRTHQKKKRFFPFKTMQEQSAYSWHLMALYSSINEPLLQQRISRLLWQWDDFSQARRCCP